MGNHITVAQAPIKSRPPKQQRLLLPSRAADRSTPRHRVGPIVSKGQAACQDFRSLVRLPGPDRNRLTVVRGADAADAAVHAVIEQLLGALHQQHPQGGIALLGYALLLIAGAR